MAMLVYQNVINLFYFLGTSNRLNEPCSSPRRFGSTKEISKANWLEGTKGRFHNSQFLQKLWTNDVCLLEKTKLQKSQQLTTFHPLSLKLNSGVLCIKSFHVWHFSIYILKSLYRNPETWAIKNTHSNLQNHLSKTIVTFLNSINFYSSVGSCKHTHTTISVLP